MTRINLSVSKRTKSHCSLEKDLALWSGQDKHDVTQNFIEDVAARSLGVFCFGSSLDAHDRISG